MTYTRKYGVLSALALSVLVAIVASETLGQSRPVQVPNPGVRGIPPTRTDIRIPTTTTNPGLRAPVLPAQLKPSAVRIAPGAEIRSSVTTAAPASAGGTPIPPEGKKDEDSGGNDSPTPTPPGIKMMRKTLPAIRVDDFHQTPAPMITPAGSPQADSKMGYNSGYSPTPLETVSPFATAEVAQEPSSFRWFWLGIGVVALIVIVGVVKNRRRYQS